MGAPQTGSISFDIEARQAHVVGKGPRIEPLNNETMDAETHELVDRIRATIGAGRPDEVPEYMRTMAKNPPIFRCQMEMGTAIFKGKVPPRERELAVLRVAWLSRAPYEWGEHVDIGKRYGITSEEVERVTQGSSAAGWNAHDSAILRGVEELIADQALTDATWEVLTKSWDDAQMLEFTMLVGQYVATAFVQNSIRVRLANDNPGLSYR